MAIDLEKPVYILAVIQTGGRLAVLGGSNDLDEVRDFAKIAHGGVILKAVQLLENDQ